MKNLYSLFKKLVLTLAILLMTTASAWAQINWSGTVTYNSNTTISQQILLAGNTTVQVASGVTVTIAGGLSGGTSSYTLTKTGAGTLVTSSNCTVNSGTTISAGIIQIGAGGTGGTWSGNIVNNATLYFNRSNDYTYTGNISGTGIVEKGGTSKLTLTGNLTYSGQTNVGGGTLQIGNGTNGGDLNSNVTLSLSTTTLRFEPGASPTYSKVISGQGKVEYKGSPAKILFLTGNNTYIGTTTVEAGGVLVLGFGTTTGAIAGNIILGAGSKLDFRRSNDYTYSGVISGTGEIQKFQSSKLTLTGANTYTGATTVSEGTLQIGNGTITTTSINSTSGVSISSGAILRFQPGASMTFPKVISGTGNVQYAGSNTKALLLTATNTYNGTTTIETGGCLYIGSNGTTGAIEGNIVNNGALYFSRSNAYTYSGIISGSGIVYQNRQGTITLNGANTYTGQTYIDEGTLALGASGSIAQSSEVFISTLYSTTKFDISAGNKTIKSLASPNADAKVVLGARTLTIGTSATSADGGGTFAGIIEGTGGGITKTGTGILYLTGNNTYTGTTTISAGNLYIGNNTTAGTIVGNIALSSGTTLIFNRSNAYTYTGVISGTGQVIKQGTAQLYFWGNHSYSGTTTISAGTLYIGDQTFTGAITGNITVSNGTSLHFYRTNDYTYSGVISGAGEVRKQGDGNLYLTGANSYTGITTIYNGSLYIGNNATTGVIAGNISVSNNTNLYFNRSNAYTYSGIISGGGHVKKSGSGTTTLTGAHTYTGSTEVVAGTLQIGNGTLTTTTINSTSGVTIGSGATLRFEPGAHMTFSKVIGGAGNVQYGGNSDNKQLRFTANNTYTGTTTIETGGYLMVGDNTTAGAIAGNIINNGGLDFRRSNDYPYSGVISGAGNVYKYGTGTTTFSGANTYTGLTGVYAGTLALGTNGSIENSVQLFLNQNTKFDISANNKKIKLLNSSYSNAEVILGSRTLTLGTAGTDDGGGVFEGFFSGTGGVTKAGTANFTMNAANNTATGTFTLNGGTLNFSGKWSGGFTKSASATLTVNGNITIGGNLTLQGGNTNMTLTGSTPSKITVTGSASASGTNTLNITANPVNDYVLIQAASGLNSTTPFTVNITALHTHLTATGSQLLLTASTTPLTPTITTTTLPDGLIGTAYSANLAATGLTPITWSFEGGMLPPGITLAANGTISGTPSTEGTFNFTVKATNGVGNAVGGLSIKVNANTTPPNILTSSLPNGVTGSSYSEQLAATGTSPITWTLESGSLPNNVTLSAEGVISGTPTAAGTFNFTVQATNSAGNDTKALAITIIAPPVITTTTLPGCVAGTAYNQTLTATGTTPITWSLSSGSLPNNVTLSAEGVISGTPTAAGTFNFTVQATNSAGSDTKALSIIVSAAPVPPTITTSTLPNGTTGVVYNAPLEAAGTSPITWTLESGSLPNNVTLSAAGVISGTPTTAGTFNFTVKATNSAGNDTKALAITIIAPPVITTTTLPGCVAGTAYNQTLTATGTTPITWTLESGSLPNNVTLSSAGVISGTPNAEGMFNFTVKATNSAGSDTKALSITVTTSTVAPTITTNTLPNGATTVAYSAELEATGTAPITWSLASGNLPNGLTLYSGGTISGTPTAIGTFNFTVQATNSAGSDTKALSIKIEDGVGIEEWRIENGELRVFPNPTRGQLTIDNGQLTIENVEVFDVYGRKQKIIINYQLSIINSIDILHLPAGIYFLKIRTEAGEVVKKVVKQ